MRTTLFSIPIIAVLALASPASSYHCDTYSTTEPTVRCFVPGDIAGTYYAVEDCCGLAGPVDCIWSFWVYEESNGIPGLQRGDEVVDDTCHRSIQADTIVF